jgi:hypothetical protein
MEHVGADLGNPALDSDGRRRVALEQCQFLDGRSAERVAGFILEELERLAGPSRKENIPSCAVLPASSR